MIRAPKSIPPRGYARQEISRSFSAARRDAPNMINPFSWSLLLISVASRLEGQASVRRRFRPWQRQRTGSDTAGQPADLLVLKSRPDITGSGSISKHASKLRA